MGVIVGGSVAEGSGVIVARASGKGVEVKAVCAAQAERIALKVMNR